MEGYALAFVGIVDARHFEASRRRKDSFALLVLCS